MRLRNIVRTSVFYSCVLTQMTLSAQSSTGIEIGDLVWNDLNHNGIQDAGEPGLAGAVVTLTLPDGTKKTKTTGADGLYLFSDLDCGTFIVSVTPPMGYMPSPSNAPGSTYENDSNTSPVTVEYLCSMPITENNERPLSALARANNSRHVTINNASQAPGRASVDPGRHIDFGFFVPNAETYKIGDFVWNDTNRNGIQDAGEVGLAGATVTLTSPDGKQQSAITAADGFYLFLNLVPGQYKVSVAPPAGFVASPVNVGSNRDVDSNTNPALVALQTADIRNIDFGYSPEIKKYSLGDFVWNDSNRNGIQDAGEPGLAGAVVKLTKPGGAVQTITTPASGFYKFADLVNGRYTVSVTPPAGGYIASPVSAPGSNANNDSNRNPSTVDVLNADVSNIDFGYAIPPRISIGDKVWNDYNRDGIQNTDEPGLGGVSVTLNCPDGTKRTTTTDAAGNYQFANLNAGTYTVTATPPTGYVASPMFAPGSTPENDSNGSPASVTLSESTATVDFGFYYMGSEPGIQGGHIDVDTSHLWYAPNKGTTDHHVHQYDDKFNVSEVNWLNLADPKFGNIQEHITDPNKQFRIVVINGTLSPGALININGVVTSAPNYRETGKLYRIGDLKTFTVFFKDNKVGGVIGTETGAVRANRPGKFGEWRNGSITIQAIDASKFTLDPNTGSVINNGGLLWEGTIFWHHKCGTYGDSNWSPSCQIPDDKPNPKPDPKPDPKPNPKADPKPNPKPGKK